MYLVVVALISSVLRFMIEKWQLTQQHPPRILFLVEPARTFGLGSDATPSISIQMMPHRSITPVGPKSAAALTHIAPMAEVARHAATFCCGIKVNYCHNLATMSEKYAHDAIG